MSSSIELASLANNPSPPLPDDQVEQSDRQHFSLPPPDKGRAAWIFLGVCFIVELFVYGFPFSYGVFQDYYSTHEPFKSKPGGIAVIGSTALGVMYLDSILIFMALQRWPNLRRPCCFIGVALIVISLFASSWATEVWHLILTQGVLYAVGGSLLYNPILLFMDEWFVRRKGLAFGMMWAGTGAGGVAIPFVISWLLAHYSLVTVLRAWAAIMGVALGPLLFFMKPRVPVTLSSTNVSRRRFDFSFCRSPAFLALQLGNLLQGLGYFIPGIYLPSYAQSVLGMNKELTTATVSLLNVTGVFGCVIVGYMIDRMHVTSVIFLLSVGSLLSVTLLWGFATDSQMLLCFSALYGLFAVPFTTTYTGVVKEVKKHNPGAEVGLVIGMLATGRGIGSVVAGPISESLLKSTLQNGNGKGYGSEYESLIVFTAVCVALGGVSAIAKRLGWL